MIRFTRHVNEAAWVSFGSHRQVCLLNEALLVELENITSRFFCFFETVSFGMPHKCKIDRTGSARGELGGHTAQLIISFKKKSHVTVCGVSCYYCLAKGEGISLVIGKVFKMV
jgi:hypothetical protein